MFYSVVAMSRKSMVYPELEGKRVLIAGLKPGIDAGADVVRGFAAQGCRLVLHFDLPHGARNDELFALAEEVRSQSLGLRVFSGPLDSDIGVARMASAAVNAFGSIDAVVTLSQLAAGPHHLESDDDFDAAVAQTLRRAYSISRVAANRMRTTMASGVVINLLAGPDAAADRKDTLLFSLVRAELAAMTRHEAQTWASQGIRFAALAPEASLLGSDGDIGDVKDAASTAVFLASNAGASINGLTLATLGAGTQTACKESPQAILPGAPAGVSLSECACAEPHL